MEKLGLVFKPDKDISWLQSHVQNPFPVQISENVFRVFFASRDANNISRPGYFDLDMRNPFAEKEFSRVPLLEVGEKGAFDDCGVMPHSIIKVNDQYLMYYTGWSKAVTVAFSFHIGIAFSDSLDGPFVRYSKAPVLGRSHYDPFIVGAPFVFRNKSFYSMFYVSCLKWEDDAVKGSQHYYTIKMAHSHDALNWQPEPDVTIELLNEEHSIARPVLYKGDKQYELWFSFRGGNNPYSLEMATSIDLRNWERKAGVISPEPTDDWDGEMICYGYPFDFAGRKYMLYNGNSYGRDGCGLAVL